MPFATRQLTRLDAFTQPAKEHCPVHARITASTLCAVCLPRNSANMSANALEATLFSSKESLAFLFFIFKHEHCPLDLDVPQHKKGHGL